MGDPSARVFEVFLIVSQPKREDEGGHRKSPKTDESRTENAPIEKQKTQRKIGNPPKKRERGHRKSPKTNEPRPEKRLAPPKIA